MRKPYKNPNSNARFAAAGFCAAKFRKRGVKFYPCNAEPEARDAEFRDFKFCNETLRHTRQIRQSRHSHFKFHGAKFTTYGTEFLGANFRGAEFCKSKFMARGVKFYKAELRETAFLARTAKFYAAKFRGNALLKFAAAKGLRRSPSLCAAPQNAGFFETKFGEAKFCSVKFHKARSRRAKFYGAEFAADGAKFCGAKRRGAGA